MADEKQKPKMPYTPAEVAKLYGMSYSRVMREIHGGRLPAHKAFGMSKCYYITDSDIEEWVKNYEK